ncbi:MAG: hypothetical protein K2X77_33035 [Candidatus Obscuribacterales bacterium]|nr:hypothetical protein [Candidatus Obscuribacterales bacterium]
MPALPGSNRELEAGRMPALPGSNRELEAGRMPALPGSIKRIRSRQDAGAPGIEPNSVTGSLARPQKARIRTLVVRDPRSELS